MRPFRNRLFCWICLVVATAAFLLLSGPVMASSHREAPYVTKHPKIDSSDFYVFNSYETGRTGFVTLVACYSPLQDPVGGPNYFTLDPEALYEIHIDNDADAVEDITFQFRFQNTLKDLALDIGPSGNTKRVSVPLINIGTIAAGNTGNLGVTETFTINVVRGDRRTGTVQAVTNAQSGETSFVKPADNIGNKSIPDYDAYAAAHVYNINIPGCSGTGRVFVGQRKDPFVVNLGETFDLVNYNPLGANNAESDSLAGKNVTAICLEVPAACLTGNSTIIGAWTSASVRQARLVNPKPQSKTGARGRASAEGGAWSQQSRLGMPLVNELLIGIKDKDTFNASEPKDDAQFLDYVTNPTLPALLEILFSSAGAKAPTTFPRQDLVDVFLLGVNGLNRPPNVTASEMQRLDTATPPVAAAQQNNLGVIAGDNAGYPNGRRPGDDVVDISLRVVMGALLDASVAPNKTTPFTDGAFIDATSFDSVFPYLTTPLAGSPTQ